MVLYNPKDWWTLIFKFHKSDTLRKLVWVILFVGAFSTFIVYITHEVIPDDYKGSHLMHSLLGFVISMLLVFRTNTAYDRWWEGRKLWGNLVNSSRNLSIKLETSLPADMGYKRTLFASLIGNFATTLSNHLIGLRTPNTAPSDVHQPNFIALKLIKEINDLYKAKHLTDFEYNSIMIDVSAFQDICGACERIKKTPIPYSYSMFIKKFIFIYILTMPFAIAGEYHYWTGLIVCFVCYVFISIELIAEEIENPFGKDSNDLPTEKIANGISKESENILTKYSKMIE